MPISLSFIILLIIPQIVGSSSSHPNPPSLFCFNIIFLLRLFLFFILFSPFPSWLMLLMFIPLIIVMIAILLLLLSSSNFLFWLQRNILFQKNFWLLHHEFCHQFSFKKSTTKFSEGREGQRGRESKRRSTSQIHNEKVREKRNFIRVILSFCFAQELLSWSLWLCTRNFYSSVHSFHPSFHEWDYRWMNTIIIRVLSSCHVSSSARRHEDNSVICSAADDDRRYDYRKQVI